MLLLLFVDCVLVDVVLHLWMKLFISVQLAVFVS